MNKRRKIGKVISHLLVAAWMLVIFNFSAQPGDESADLSGGISHLFMTVLNQVFSLGWDEVRVLEMAGVWDFPIRKLAHMTEFGILAVLLFAAVRYYVQKSNGKKHYIAAWMGAVLYAATDELHQLYVRGRNGNLFDVCVDATGVTIALGIVCLIMKVMMLKGKRKFCG